MCRLLLLVGQQWITLLRLFRSKDGALAASVFHKQVINIGELKQYLNKWVLRRL